MKDTFTSLMMERKAAMLRLQGSITSLSIQILRLKDSADPEEAFRALAGPSKDATRAIDNSAAQIETISQQFQAELDDEDD